jgi:gluconolactonase
MSRIGIAHQLGAPVPVCQTDAHEGPVYAANDSIYFTTRGGSIKCLALRSGGVREVIAEVTRANGMTLGHDGALVVCEQGSMTEAARISRVDPVTGGTETIVDGWRGLSLNSPNDVVARSDGSIWFTDPSYGFLQGFRPRPEIGDSVHRFDPRTGNHEIAADSFDKPNGLAFSPDEQVLYVTDSGANHEEGSYHPDRPHHVKAFDVHEGHRLENERIFCVVTPGFPDGIKCDSEGRVYVSCFDGVQVYDPGGTLVREIELPGAVNFTFGGVDRAVLFITTDDAVWAAVPTPKGA